MFIVVIIKILWQRVIRVKRHNSLLCQKKTQRRRHCTPTTSMAF